MVTTVERDEQMATVEEVLELFDQAALLLRSLGDRRIEAYCLADLEGRERGWMGHFVRDILEETLEAWREGRED